MNVGIYQTYISKNELYHHGILGMKWGVRRFETKDGHLTPEGKERYDKYNELTKKNETRYKEMDKAIKGNANLKRDLVSAKYVDDEDLFVLLADEYHVNIKDYLKADKDYRTFYNENRDLINEGRKIANKLVDTGKVKIK